MNATETETGLSKIMLKAPRTLPHENGAVLNAAIDDVNFRFTYYQVVEDHENYKGLGISRSDFENWISEQVVVDEVKEKGDTSESTEDDGDSSLMEIYQTIIRESEGAGNLDVEGQSVSPDQIKIFLDTLLADHYLSTGEMQFASVLLKERAICTWRYDAERCTLNAIYCNGKVLSDQLQIQDVKEKIKKMDKELIHLYWAEEDNYYDSLELLLSGEKEALTSPSSQSRSNVVRYSYISRTLVPIGALTATGIFAYILRRAAHDLSRNMSRVAINLFGQVFRFSPFFRMYRK